MKCHLKKALFLLLLNAQVAQFKTSSVCASVYSTTKAGTYIELSHIALNVN